MQYRCLPGTELRVSQLGLGTVQLGMPYGLGLLDPPADEECERLLCRALDLGINYFDTAASYGRSEEVLGQALSGAHPEPVVATKVGVRGDAGTALTGAALRDHIEGSLLRSLRRLRLDRLDLVQIHNGDAETITDELLEIMDSMRNTGLVRFWGATTYGEEYPLAVLKAGQEHFATLQVAYNLLDRSLEARVIPQGRARGVALILRSIFLKGVLSDRWQHLPDHLSSLGAAAGMAAEVAAAAGISLSELALRFAVYNPGIAPHVAVVGTASIPELEANVSALNAGPLPQPVLAALESIAVEDAALLNPGNWQ